MDPAATPESAQASGNVYYNIFPVPDTNYSDTASFIASTVGSSDLSPWTDVRDNLMSWTVEADNNQVAQLSSYANIKQVTRLDIPLAPSTAPKGLGEDVPTTLERRQDAQEWIVFPTNAANYTEVNETALFLKSLTGAEPKRRHESSARKFFWLWTAVMTESQRNEAVKNPGIKAIEPNSQLSSSSVAIPPAERLNVPSKVKRAISFDTQRDSVAELVSISQPSTVPDAGQLKNYVFESNNGRKSFVYHVEHGVAFLRYPQEFPNVAKTHLFTEESPGTRTQSRR